MSSFTNFLNLFKWNAVEDGEEEFDIDKALNDNWDKIDTKLETHIKGVNKEVNDFKTEVKSGFDTFKQQTNNTVQDLADGISSTQVFHKYKLIITENIELEEGIILPCNYKVGQDVLDVFFNGERLLLSSNEEGTDGHYVEIGELNSISNKIKITTDWNLKIGDVLELIVRGEYANDTE